MMCEISKQCIIEHIREGCDGSNSLKSEMSEPGTRQN